MSRQRRCTASSSSAVARLDGDVDGTALQVQLADRVANDRRRLANRQVVLPVAAAEPARAEPAAATPLDERGGHLEVTPLSGRPVQLDERHLDLGMAVDAVVDARPELALDGSGRTLGDEEETIVAERAVPGDGRLEEMSDAVELVAPVEIPVLGAGGEHLDERVEVAVGSLGGLDEADRLVGHRGDRRVVPRGPAPSRRPRATCRRRSRGTGTACRT